MDGPCPTHAQLALVEVLSSLSSTLFMLERQLQEGEKNYIFYQFLDIFLIFKNIEYLKNEKWSVT